MDLVDLVALNAKCGGALFNNHLHLAKARCLRDHLGAHPLVEGEDAGIAILHVAQEVGGVNKLRETV
uniref:Unannotated protein n=1 Tax=freshwater metagenome TaxID=449393 RepID=A0A6J6A1V0_9ZZZZ